MKNTLTVADFRRMHPTWFANDLAEFSDGQEYDATQVVINNLLVNERVYVTYGDVVTEDIKTSVFSVNQSRDGYLRQIGEFKTLQEAVDFARKQ
jgi:hypothetical protein